MLLFTKPFWASKDTTGVKNERFMENLVRCFLFDKKEELYTPLRLILGEPRTLLCLPKVPPS